MNDWRMELAIDLARRGRNGLRRRLYPRSAIPFPYFDLHGKQLINFAANDYLGLSTHPKVVSALAAGAWRWGAGAGASHLLSGHTQVHADFEQALADFLGTERSLLFSSGYQANLAVIGALADRRDSVIEDYLNHASLIDAARLSGARLLRYAHADVEAARKRLLQASGRRLLVTDGVFSMDGDLAPVVALGRLAEETDALLIVDDAHGFGVVGESGRGVARLPGVPARVLAAQIVTLGKGMGVVGAAVAGDEILIDTLINHGRSYIYTTALPPALAEALLVALEVLREETWRQIRVAEHVERFRSRALAVGMHLADSKTPIQPVMIGSVTQTMTLSARLEQRGFYVPAIRPPTVPQGTARLRVSLSAAHETGMIDALVQALAEENERLDSSAP